MKTIAPPGVRGPTETKMLYVTPTAGGKFSVTMGLWIDGKHRDVNFTIDSIEELGARIISESLAARMKN